jgi:hypothetical protein
MTSISEYIYARKDALELLANNVNHPNDFLVRQYVSGLMETIAK